MVDLVTDIPTLKPVVYTAADGGTDDACEVCKRTGLAILPTRYAVVPASCKGELGAVSPREGCLASVTDEGYKYVLRTLRKGYLYLFFEDGPDGTNYFEAYSVAENGTLWWEPSATMVIGIKGGGVPACRRSGHSATRTEFIVIPEPEECGTVWLAFSQHRWQPDVLNRYAKDAKLRAKRMHPIEPAKWVNSPQGGGDIGAITSHEVIKQVMEYHSHAEVIGEPPELPHHRKAAKISRADGSFNRAVLQGNATRYPWWLRNQQERGDTETDISVHTTYGALRGSSRKDSGGREGRQFHVPMMVALTDPVGIVHELNGYRSDVLGHIARYHDELMLEINALDHVSEIQLLLQNNAVAMTDAKMNTIKAMTGGSTYEQGLLRPSEAGLAAEHSRLEQSYFGGEIDFAAYKSLRTATIRRHADSSGTPENPLSRSPRDIRIAELERIYSMQDSWRQRQAALPNDHWERLSAKELERHRKAATEQWNEKYRPLIDWPRYTKFKANVDSFLSQADSLLEQRSKAIAHWLESAELWNTLEDYSGKSIGCGMAFETVIVDAIAGLGGDAEGRKILKKLAGNLAVTEPGCLLWRVIAFNQSEARTQLEQALKRAEAETKTETGGADAAWKQVESVAAYIKTLKKNYELAEKIKKDEESATAGLLKGTGVDRFTVNAGAILLNHFPLKHLNLTVGHAIARFALAQRAMMDTDEALDLIRTQARNEPLLRKYFQERLQYYWQKYGRDAGVLTLAFDDLERHQGHKILRDQWSQVAKTGNPLKLAGLAAVLEVINFANILQKSDKGSKEYAQLLASGMSMVSVYSSVATTINKELFSEKSLSYAKAQAVGSYLGGAASLMGAFLDLTDAVYAGRQGRAGTMAMLVVKSAAGTVVGAAQVITALSYSAPLLRRAIGPRGSVVFLESLQGSIAHASKVPGAIAARGVGMRRLGLTIVRLGGWQVTLAVAAIEGIVWVLSPNPLEEWCEKNHFSLQVRPWVLGLGGSSGRYKTAKDQDDAFDAAIKKVVETGGRKVDGAENISAEG